MPCVPSQTRWLLSRCSSAISTRIQITRSGIALSSPSSRSTDRQNARLFDCGAEVVHPLDERDDLLPLLLLGGLLDAGVQEPDRRVGRDDGLAVELEHQPQHAVRAGVLRPHVDGHRLGADLRHRVILGRTRRSAPTSRVRPHFNLTRVRTTAFLQAHIDVQDRPVHFLHPRRVGGRGTFTCTSASRPALAAVAAGQRDRRQSAGERAIAAPRSRWPTCRSS